ncbi:flagellar motor protein MotB [Aquabacterium fontiphilum]|jgi:chemotaxis protein MotB|uniref:flagellar motor protein MotB n=1 Tax=Aquabacterium fontiphilum TaxID=450365 RepID=UPI0013774217|nr:flagellar motor protein MotB [Aquabacterium fontiphilum]NBD20625.1 flagellar motor protein MotB [Aquabacterium fontiphilum]
MAGDSKKVQPIIIKRIKKGGHAAHGGAWKIAYADFVTAMMAFFLLMWLLGSTTEGDKKGIEDYFNSPLKVALMGGSGSGDATSIIKGGGTSLTESVGQAKKGRSETAEEKLRKKAIRAEQLRAEAERLRVLMQKVQEVIANDDRLAKFQSQIRLDLTAEGLRIQIVDDQSRPMFDSGSDVVNLYVRDILRAIGSVLREVPNRLTIEGHTDARPFVGGEAGYSNWELSADRANASRRELIAGGLPGERVLRVQGLAASMPFDWQDPMSPLNRRISIIVMNRDAEDRFYDTAKAEAGVSDDEADEAPTASPQATPQAPLRPAELGR